MVIADEVEGWFRWKCIKLRRFIWTALASQYLLIFWLSLTKTETALAAPWDQKQIQIAIWWWDDQDCQGSSIWSFWPKWWLLRLERAKKLLQTSCDGAWGWKPIRKIPSWAGLVKIRYMLKNLLLAFLGTLLLLLCLQIISFSQSVFEMFKVFMMVLILNHILELGAKLANYSTSH